MQEDKRYPLINIRSKNELAKRICSRSLYQKKALELINDVILNFDKYWYDSKKSEPEKEKFVRSSIGTPLHKLSRLINTKILKVHDYLVPGFIFGGISKRSHIDAAYELIGTQNKRTLLKLDISKFFEQITDKRIFYFFHKKCGCSVSASWLLTSLCCVPLGKKGIKSEKKTLARGFPTSSRLAVWTNLDTFLHLKWEAHKILKGHDSRIAVFVDDIGVSASRIDSQVMESLKEKLQRILVEHDVNQGLIVNSDKTKIISFKAGAEHLGLRLGKNKISIGNKTKSKIARLNNDMKLIGGSQKKDLKKTRIAYFRYKKQIKVINEKT